MRKSTIVGGALLFLCFSDVSAQTPALYTSTINAAGGSGNLSGNNYEWSVGEMALVNTASSSNIIVTQGVLQPAQSAGSVHDNNLVADNVKVYPVPASSTVNLSYNYPQPGIMRYELTDITGKTILQRQIDVVPGSNAEKINLEQLANAGYMLNVKFNSSNGTQSSSAFKLEKIN